MRIPFYIPSREDIVQCEASGPVALAYAVAHMVPNIAMISAAVLLLPRAVAIFMAGAAVTFLAPFVNNRLMPLLFLRTGLVTPVDVPSEPCRCAGCVAAKTVALLSSLALFKEQHDEHVAATELDAFASRVVALFSEGDHDVAQDQQEQDASERCPVTGEAECRACIADEVAADLQMLGDMKQKDADGCAIPFVSWEAETLGSFAHSLRAMFPHPEKKP